MKVVLALPMWLLHMLLQLPLMLLGVVLCAVAPYKGAHFTWPWVHLWDNDKDGVAGPGIPNPTRWQVWKWSAWRNSVGNAKEYWPFGIISKGSPSVADAKLGPYLVHQGPYYELKFTWNPKNPDWTKRRIFWIGWRLVNSQAGARQAFACQLWASLA